MLQHFAYLDAGTGSMFIQAIIGLGMASSFVLRRSIRQFATKLRLIVSRTTN